MSGKRPAGSLDGLPGEGGLNIAFEAVDRHVAHGDGDRVAFRFIDAGTRGARSITYAELARSATASPMSCGAWTSVPAMPSSRSPAASPKSTSRRSAR